jgi:hypothetical protein
MSDEELPRDDTQTQRALQGVKFALVSIIAGISYLDYRASLAISSFRQIFADMLDGRVLPPVGAFVLPSRSVFLVVSCLIPAVAICTLFIKPRSQVFYLLGALTLAAVVAATLLLTALWSPLLTVIDQLGTTPKP